MTEVYWLEQSESDVPATNAWLSQSEATRLAAMRFEKRSKSWRLGRWTAKCAIAAYRKSPRDSSALQQVEIRAASSGAPEVFLAGQPAPITISLSHRDGTAVCAIASGNVALGCDIEAIEPHSEAFAADYFTAEEQALVARSRVEDQSRLLALLWSGKESALKALREGLRLDTRSVIVCFDETADFSKALRSLPDSKPAGDGWIAFHVSCTSGQIFPGWWQMSENFVRTLVATPPPAPPLMLAAPVPTLRSNN